MKVLIAGTAVALFGGLLLGGAMRPNLIAADDGRPAGPQMFANWHGASTGPFDPGAAFVSGGEVPDYVLGTDWKKATARPDERAAVSAPNHEIAHNAETPEAPATLASSDYADPPAAARDYPSLNGGHVSESDDAGTAVGD